MLSQETAERIGLEETLEQLTEPGIVRAACWVGRGRRIIAANNHGA